MTDRSYPVDPFNCGLDMHARRLTDRQAFFGEVHHVLGQQGCADVGLLQDAPRLLLQTIATLLPVLAVVS